MNVLIIKDFQYRKLSGDSKFSIDAALCRLRKSISLGAIFAENTKVTVIVPSDEIGLIKKHLSSDNLIFATHEQANTAVPDLPYDAPILVIDEQALYLTSEIIKKVLSVFSGKPAAYNDPEKLLWSFNYSDSAKFLICPYASLKEILDFRSLSFQLIYDKLITNGSPTYYTLSHDDIPPFYLESSKFNPYPYHYYLEPTSRCNSKCIMCPFHSTDPKIAKGRVYVGDGGEEMDLNLFKQLVDEIVSIPQNYLPYYRIPQITAQLRGEPLMATHFKAMAKYVKENKIRLSFSTNGFMLNNEMIDFLLDIGTDEIIVSIDGNREEYNKIRPQLDFDTVVKNLIALRKKRNILKLSLPRIYTKRVKLKGSSNAQDMKYIEKFTKIADVVGMAFENYDDFLTESKGYTNYFFDVDDLQRVPCIWASDVTVVKADGMVDLCFGASMHYIGNVKEKSFLEILKNSPLRQSVLQAHGKGCFNCNNFCAKCTSWKHNYHKFFDDGKYSVQMNAVMAYWTLKNRENNIWAKVKKFLKK